MSLLSSGDNTGKRRVSRSRDSPPSAVFIFDVFFIYTDFLCVLRLQERSRSGKNRNCYSDKGDGLTFKDASVGVDAGSELIRRITKMAPGIRGFSSGMAFI